MGDLDGCLEIRDLRRASCNLFAQLHQLWIIPLNCVDRYSASVSAVRTWFTFQEKNGGGLLLLTMAGCKETISYPRVIFRYFTEREESRRFTSVRKEDPFGKMAVNE